MAISVGSVEVDVVPNTRGIYQQLRSQLTPAATRAGQDAGNAAGRAFGPAMRSEVGQVGLQLGQQIGSQIASRITAEIRGALRDGITQGGRTARPAATRQGSEAGGAFARSARARIEAAFRSLPDITIGADTSEADSDLQALRARMQALSSRTIGVDLDAADARAQITDIEEQLRRLGASHPDVSVRADTARARAELTALRAEIDRISANPAHIRVETDGSFGQRLRAQVQAAEASLPNINIGADTTAAEAQVAALRGRLTALRDVRIGVDMDAATAQAEIADIQARLERLSAQDADIAVRVDTGAAAAQLAAVQAMVNRLDGQSAHINIDTRGAMMAVLQLTVALAGVAAIPAVPVLAAGIGSIAAAATAAGAGVGALAAVAAPAIKDISGALQAQKAAQDAATQSTGQGGQAAAQAARQSLQQAGAQQQLAAAHRNAARQIAQAEQGVQDAVRSAAQANSQAAEQVRSARQGLAQAYEQAADRMRSANDQVRNAEQSLADAQRTARQAQADLTQARRDAKAELQDLSNRLASAQLSERDATLSVQEAQARLRATQSAGSKATVLEQQRARLAYDQALQRLREQRLDTQRLSAEKATADRTGVAGTATVRSAEERLAAARRGVAKQEAALGKARANMSRQQIQNSRDIAGAQQKVAQAQRNVASTQEAGARSVARAQQQLVAARQSAADSIASAERQVRSAQLSSAGGADAAASAQAKYQAALAKLTPSARGTFNAFVRLRSAFSAWSRSLQPAVMPLFTRALNGMRKALPSLTPFVLAAARAIGRLQDKVSEGFKSPWWRTFKKDLARSVEPAIVGLGISFGRIFKGMAGIVGAFLPHMDDISRTMQRITGRFADWGTGLKGSPAFERFLDYSSEMGPKLADALGKISTGFLQVSKSLAPLSGPALAVLGGLAAAIGSIAETLPWLVQGLYLALIATRLWTIGLVIFNAVMNANPITLIVIAIIALVAAVVYAYKHWTGFRNVVQAAWRGIQTAALWAWNVVLKPVFAAVMVAVRAIGRVAMWLWTNAIQPAFRGIATVVMWWWTNIVQRYFALVRGAFRLVGRIATWLWRSVIAPAFRGIVTVGKWLAMILLVVVFGPIIVGIRLLAKIGKWLWKNALAPAFRGIAAVGRWLWAKVLRPVWNAMKAAIRALGAVFRWLYNKVVKPVFNGIKAVIAWWWNNVVKRYFNFVKTALRGLGTVFRWLYNKVVKPVWSGIRSVISGIWNKGIKPVFNALKRGVHLVAEGFRKGKDAIGKQWAKIRDLTKKPIKWVVDVVYNKGVRGLWNTAAKVLPIKKLPVFKFATGGAVHGPGTATSDSIPARLSRGEHVWTAKEVQGAGGHAAVESMRSAAAGGAYAKGGPVTTRSGVPGFALGGAVDWFKDRGSDIAGGAKAAVGAVGKGLGKLKDAALGGVYTAAKAAAKPVRALINKVPGGTKGWGSLAKALPTGILDEVLASIKGSENAETGGEGIARALKWAKSQAGKPYQWGGAGNPSWDCSGFMSGIQKKIQGKNPKGRLWSTHSFSGSKAPSGWKRHKKSPFQIGITNRGKGHTAGTLAGTNVESRGGDGVVVGSRAHGYNARMFGKNWYGFVPAIGGGGFGAKAVGAAQQTAKQMLGEFGWGQNQFGPLKKLWQHESNWRWNAKNPSSGAYGIPQALPGRKMRSAGKDWKTNPTTQIKWGLGYIKGRPDYGSPARAWAKWQSRSPHWYDSGGMLQPGLNLAYNGTGRPEPVLTGRQWDVLSRAASGGDGAALGGLQVAVYVGDREITDIARAEVRSANGKLVRTLKAGR